MSVIDLALSPFEDAHCRRLAFLLETQWLAGLADGYFLDRVARRVDLVRLNDPCETDAALRDRIANAVTSEVDSNRLEVKMSKPKKFREVEPLRATAIVCTRVRDQLGRTTEITIFGNVVAMAVAREIRDWLNRVLPEEKP